MLTREQRRLRRIKRLILLAVSAIVAVIFVASVCIALSVPVRAAFDAEAYKTTLSVIGALWLAGGLMRVVAWLDGER